MPVRGGPVHDKDYVLRQRLGLGDKEQAAIERGVGSVEGSVGRLYKGAVMQKYGTPSVIGMAKQNVFEFPVFVSNNVPLDYATAVNSLLEQVYASYLQMALTIDPVVDSEDVRKFGGQFSKFKTDTTKYVECVELDFQRDACHNVFTGADYTMEFSLASIDDQDASIIIEALEYQPLSEFDHYFQEDANDVRQDAENIRNSVRNGSTPDDGQQAGQIRARAGQLEETAEKLAKLARENEASATYRRRQTEYTSALSNLNNALQAEAVARDTLRNASRADRRSARAALDNAIAARETAQNHFNQVSARLTNPNDPEVQSAEYKKLKAEVDKMVNDVKKQQQDEVYAANREQREREKHAADMKNKAPQQLDETKLNKLNTMKPLMMVVNLSIMDKNGSVSRPIEYMVGVKTHCRMIEASTLPEVVKYPVREMDKISRKAKWRAGELKFFKDIVFDVQGKKQTAIDSKDPNRKWYRRLYQLAHMQGDVNVTKRVTGKTWAGAQSGLIPNTTIVLTQSDVDMIEEETKIDLMKTNAARAFCKELFMMGIIVVDIDAESIKILFPDINNDYEVQSLAAVNRQIAQLDTSGAKTRDVFKMLT
jgi:hypothetical protein